MNQMPEGPGMAKMLSKMPGFMRKMMMTKRIESFMKMDEEPRKKNLVQMLGQVSMLDENGMKNMISTRREIALELKQKDQKKAEMLTMGFQKAFLSLPKEVQEKIRSKMEMFSGKKLSPGNEWKEFDT